MAKKKGQHGGRRAGAGRKPVDPELHFRRLSVTVPKDVFRKLAEIMKKHGWTRSQAVAEAIRRFMGG